MITIDSRQNRENLAEPTQKTTMDKFKTTSTSHFCMRRELRSLPPPSPTGTKRGRGSVTTL